MITAAMNRTVEQLKPGDRAVITFSWRVGDDLDFAGLRVIWMGAAGRLRYRVKADPAFASAGCSLEDFTIDLSAKDVCAITRLP